MKHEEAARLPLHVSCLHVSRSRLSLHPPSPRLHSRHHHVRRRSKFMSNGNGSGKGTINVCLVGQKFMGRTHSNAFLKVGKFFDVPVLPVMHTICGRNDAELREFKDRWGWRSAT